jgi:hypothetical protein
MDLHSLVVDYLNLLVYEHHVILALMEIWILEGTGRQLCGLHVQEL